MIFKKKLLLLVLFFIIIFQTLLYTNNNKEKTSFRYLKWTVQEVSIGKLISISFFSGLFISTLLNTTFTYKKKSFENIEENYEPLDNEKDIKPNIEMPPQRDIRDTQPTLSVNYRVVKNTEENNSKSNQSVENNSNKIDDWDQDDDDW